MTQAFRAGATFRNENNFLPNAFIQGYFLLDMTGLNTPWKVVGKRAR
jgi:hypothetical protein